MIIKGGLEMNELVTAGGGVSRIEYGDKPVLTTAQLAKFYDCETYQIKQNYGNNKERFIEGKHFFKLEGEELQKFRNLQVEDFDLQISPMTRSLYLWTKQGVARHSKMLNSEQAWAVFEVLEETYFDTKPGKYEEITRLLEYASPEMRDKIVSSAINKILGEKISANAKEEPRSSSGITPRAFMEAWLADKKNAEFIIVKNGKRCILPHSTLIEDAAKAGFTRRELLKPLADNGAIDISFEVSKGKRKKRFTIAVRIGGKKTNIIKVLF
jgi:hypothetical protein